MRTFYIDIDNTICHTPGVDYSSAIPWPDKIAIVNRLHDAGHRVVMWTARGALNGLTPELYQLTAGQLAAWGVRYHSLQMDKPYFDVLIDDRALTSLAEVP